MSLKLRALKATIRAANQLRAKKELKALKSHILRVKGKKTEAKHTFKQKAKIGGGQEPITTGGTRYGVGATEHKVYEPGAALARKRWGNRWPHEREGWRAQMDRMYGGVHMAQDPKRAKKSIKILMKNYNKRFKKKKVVKALRGALIKKGTKLAFKLATKKYPEVFKKKRFSVAEYKAKKMRKTPELASLGVTKIAANDLRKLAVAQAIKSRLTKLGNTAIKHHKKMHKIIKDKVKYYGQEANWDRGGKAKLRFKDLKQVFNIGKYNQPATKRKLESLGKQYENLTKYQDTLKAKTATKHSEGGEVVFGKNVDKDLL